MMMRSSFWRLSNNLFRFAIVPQTRTFLYRFSSKAGSEKLKIDELTKNSKVVVFMKGVKEQPMCGFSNAVVQILNAHGVDFDAYNVLENDELRQGIKDFTNWPTIPQVFFDGEFIGGCDILLDMHRDGSILDELKKIGVTSKLVRKTSDEKD